METMTLKEMRLVEFEKLARLVYEQSGIKLEPPKRDLLQARLRKRLKALGLNGFKDYLKFVARDPTGEELIQMMDCVTTNKTEFFREGRHFEHLAEQALPALLQRPDLREEPLRLWSAACSTGEEVYSLAMTALERVGGTRVVKVLGTDLSTQVLAKALEGRYDADKTRGVPEAWRVKYFIPEEAEGRTLDRAGHLLKKVARFSRLNLNGEDYSFRAPFDVIFCRNVMIYFDAATQQKLVTRLTGCLKKGGYLYTGLSESLLRVKHGLVNIGPSIYQKP
jgi:chemotaxis protein methyltransferase CheR